MKKFILVMSFVMSLSLSANYGQAVDLKKANQKISQLQVQLAETTQTNEVLQAEVNYLEKINADLKNKPAISRGTVVKSLSMKATAYTHTGNRTASGIYPKAGRTIAVDPKVIPIGSIVYIEGIGYRVAEDTGGVIKGHIIDLFMDTKQECVDWGRRDVRVYIVK